MKYFAYRWYNLLLKLLLYVKWKFNSIIILQIEKSYYTHSETLTLNKSNTCFLQNIYICWTWYITIYDIYVYKYTHINMIYHSAYAALSLVS